MNAPALGRLNTNRALFGRLPAPCTPAGNPGLRSARPSEHASLKCLLKSSVLSGTPVLGGHCSYAASGGPRRGSVRVTAVFERFTERSIKAVLLAQKEARMFGSAQVSFPSTRMPSADVARSGGKLARVRGKRVPIDRTARSMVAGGSCFPARAIEWFVVAVHLMNGGLPNFLGL